MELAARWSSLDELIAAHDPLRLDLGCGWVKEPGYVGLDDLRGVGGLEGQSPDNERGPDLLLDHVFAESHRVLRPGGRFVAIVPYANSADGMAPGHNIFLTERFFEHNPSFREKFALD